MHNTETYSSFGSMGTDRISQVRRRTKLQNKDLQELYTFTIHNRYPKLSYGVDYVTEKYEKLIYANAETAEILIQIRERLIGKKLVEGHRLVKVRTKVHKTIVLY